MIPVKTNKRWSFTGIKYETPTFNYVELKKLILDVGQCTLLNVFAKVRYDCYYDGYVIVACVHVSHPHERAVPLRAEQRAALFRSV